MPRPQILAFPRGGRWRRSRRKRGARFLSGHPARRASTLCHPERSGEGEACAAQSNGSQPYVIPTSSRQGAMADGALRLPPRPLRLPLLFPKSSSILFGSPVKATERRDLARCVSVTSTFSFMPSPFLRGKGDRLRWMRDDLTLLTFCL